MLDNELKEIADNADLIIAGVFIYKRRKWFC